ncbi:hypothetical protein HOP50_02g14930 [Chloropicon primus]|uniref:Uncharacterized protein n=1 Tax=Chloropicon primus TaxID=1764295 RepID=A0A5B8MH11_9CHLO|nr:hypothetical protein A3770_02p15030 [Chloropicon primus]UPQ98193.1 hypothetical protein HOP50_02g14930 [Chloropicon primus]|eukprot:QDZ18985.1 hypothetical protein A3770_02p15030 [Chloropicon primus]
MMREGGYPTPPSTAKTGVAPWFAPTSRSEKGLTPTSRRGERGGQWVVWAVGACLLCVITVLLAEIIVILALAAGPALSLTAEMNGLVRNMNGFLAGSSQAGFATQAAPSANQTSSSPSNATVVGEGAEDALLEWCEGAACLSGQNCTEVLTHLAEGVDPATGAPIIPLPQPFCNSVKVMNENLCFCGDAHADFPEEARVLLDNLGFVSMLCSGFGQENIGQSGRCAAGGGRP